MTLNAFEVNPVIDSGALRAHRAAAAFHATPYPFLLLAEDLTVLDTNEAYARTTGKSRRDLVGQRIFEVLAPGGDPSKQAAAQAIKDAVERVFHSGKSDTIMFLRFAIERDTPDGPMSEERYWNTVLTPVLDDHRKVAFVVSNPIDVTELYAVHQALQASTAEHDFALLAEGNIVNRSKGLAEANRILEDEHERLRRVFQQAPGFIAILLGADHVYDIVNDSYYQLVGYRDLIGKPVREALPELAGQGYFELFDNVFSSGTPFVGRQMPVQLKAGENTSESMRYIDFLLQPLFDTDGQVTGIFAQGNDVTDQKLAQEALEYSNERWKLAIEGSRDGVWDWNITTGITTLSKRWKELLGFADDEIASRYEEWASRVHPDDQAVVDEALQACLRGEPYYNEHRLRCKDGTWKWMLGRAVVSSRDAQGNPTRITGTMSDISERKESEELVWRHANFDSLTGLPNRRLFHDRLAQEIRNAHRTGSRVGLLFIDLDRFKEVNDLMGHAAGDSLLIEAARRLTACVPEADTVARLGGDEFTIILPHTHDNSHIETIAQNIIRTFKEPFRLANEMTHVSASIGITLYPDDAVSVDELIRNADQAMYAAKHAGRSRFRFFTRPMQEEAQKRIRLIRDLREALAGGQLQVHFQPIIELASGLIAKAEALVRWNHPKLGMIAPAKFIPLAEEFGQIHEIGDWIFREAVSKGKRWSDKTGRAFEISVNRSPIQFLGQASDIDWIHSTKASGLPPQSITVEITEGTLLNASPDVMATLLAYRDAGIQVALDDFGTGYSSMSYLMKFHIDYLKIDQSFIQDIDNNPDSRTIAESMILMAHRLGMKVIAEGVETASQEAILREAGCDYGQGFFYSEALPSDAFEKLLIGKT